MKKTFKFIALLLCFTLTFLVGCGNDSGNSGNVGGEEQQQTATISVAGVTGVTMGHSENALEVMLATKIRSPKNSKVYSVDQKQSGEGLKVLGITEQDIESESFERFTFSILTENGVVPTIKFGDTTADITSQTALKGVESYMRIYNEEEARMTCYNVGQWTIFEVNAEYLTQMQIMVNENQSYYIADARLERQSFGCNYSPISVYYAGGVVGGMVGFNYTKRQSEPDGRTSIIADDNCMRFTSTTKDGVSCIKVETKGERRAIMQPIGFDAQFIKDYQIKTISIRLRADGAADNIMARANGKDAKQLFHASLKLPNETSRYSQYLSVNGTAGATLSNSWQTLTINISDVRDISSYAVLEGLDLHLFVNSGTFYIADVTLY